MTWSRVSGKATLINLRDSRVGSMEFHLAITPILALKYTYQPKPSISTANSIADPSFCIAKLLGRSQSLDSADQLKRLACPNSH